MGYKKVEKAPGVAFYWNPNLGIRYNIQANLEGYEAEDGSLEFKGFSSSSREEQKAAAELLVGLQDYKIDSAYLLRVIEPTLEKLHSQKHGKPSLLYTILRHAIEQSTDKYSQDLESVQQEIQKQGEIIRPLFDNYNHLKEKLAESRKAEIALQKLRQKLRAEEANLNDQLSHLNRKKAILEKRADLFEKDVADLKIKYGVLEKMPLSDVGSDASSKFRKKYSEDLDNRIAEKEAKKQSLLEEKQRADLKQQGPKNERAYLNRIADKIKKSLNIITQVGSIVFSDQQVQELGNVGKWSRWLRRLWPVKIKESSGISENLETVALIENQLREMGFIKRPIIVTNEKQFEWDEGKSLCDNMKELLQGYKNRPGYHSPDRLKSADTVLDEIKNIKGNDNFKTDAERDSQLLKKIREQNVGSHGFNRKKSLLNRIYLEAELSQAGKLRYVLSADTKKLKELKSLPEKISNAVGRKQESLALSHKRIQVLQLGNGSIMKGIEKNNNEIKALREAIEDLKIKISQKRNELLELQRKLLILGVQANSSQNTRAEEARFIQQQLPKLDENKALGDEIDVLSDEVDALNKELETVLSDISDSKMAISLAYSEMTIVSKRCEGVEMKEADISALNQEDSAKSEVVEPRRVLKAVNEVATSIENFAKALKENNPQSELIESSDEEQSSLEAERSESSDLDRDDAQSSLGKSAKK